MQRAGLGNYREALGQPELSSGLDLQCTGVSEQWGPAS